MQRPLRYRDDPPAVGGARKKPVLLGGKDRLEPTSTAAEPQGVSHCLHYQTIPSARERSTLYNKIVEK